MVEAGETPVKKKQPILFIDFKSRLIARYCEASCYT